MLFKNIKTGNLLEADNKDTIEMMKNQPNIYSPHTPSKAVEGKPVKSTKFIKGKTR